MDPAPKGRKKLLNWGMFLLEKTVGTLKLVVGEARPPFELPHHQHFPNIIPGKKKLD
jgi:hypothetical protein